MSNFVFNIAKGRAAEFYNRVENNDPANSALILVPLSASATEAAAQDAATLTAALAAGMVERTSGGWVRKTLTDSTGGTANTGLAAFPGPDNTNNRYDLPLPSVTWTTPAVGNNITGILVCYDSDTTSGTDANIIPISHHDLVFVTDGQNLVLNASTFYQAGP